MRTASPSRPCRPRPAASPSPPPSAARSAAPCRPRCRPRRRSSATRSIDTLRSSRRTTVPALCLAGATAGVPSSICGANTTVSPPSSLPSTSAAISTVHDTVPVLHAAISCAAVAPVERVVRAGRPWPCSTPTPRGPHPPRTAPGTRSRLRHAAVAPHDARRQRHAAGLALGHRRRRRTHRDGPGRRRPRSSPRRGPSPRHTGSPRYW